MTAKSLVSLRVAEQLGAAIVRGSIAPGEPLPSEQALCQEYGASRTAVREALKLLGSKQLVSARPRIGGVVNDMARWSMLDPDILRWIRGAEPHVPLLRDLASLRIAIEPEAAAAAARLRDPVALAKLGEAVAAMAADPADALAADAAFHTAILTGSGNRFFAGLGPMIESALALSIPVTNRVKQVPKADVAAHRALYEAIRDGEVEGARALAHAMNSEALRLIDSIGAG